MRTIAQTTSLSISDEQNPAHVRQIAVRHVHGDSYNDQAGMVEIVVFDANGVELGIPLRLKMSDSGGRVAADFPGVSDEFFMTTGDHGGAGSITTG